ncbi:gliding motility protein [Streptomyces sp. NPDC015220]|uniref:gliding motility protein n=1 Tax=Streptomyces sp. NPDC015220 TaxID=3364947 RepID=UPI0036F81198
MTASGPESVHSEVGGSPADAGAGEEATKAGDGGGEDAAGTGSGAADGVEIPKQQSADEVAEQETGKGART